jgi:predicted nucleotide-binding protein (sugar kinase/HSP70/actin superfamily)
MTTEGDGNYQLQKFLESEGGECDIQLTTAWLLYNIWEVARDTRERRDLRGIDGGQYGLEGVADNELRRRQAHRHHARSPRPAARGLPGLRAAARPPRLPPARHGPVAEVADQYYSNDLRGGEGHMEVGKLIVNVVARRPT